MHENISHFGWSRYIFFPFYSFPNWKLLLLDVAIRNSYEKNMTDGEKNEQTGGGKIGTKRDGKWHEQFAHVLRNAKEMMGHVAAAWRAPLT